MLPAGTTGGGTGGVGTPTTNPYWGPTPAPGKVLRGVLPRTWEWKVWAARGKG